MLILLYIFLTAAVVQLIYYLAFFRKLAHYKEPVVKPGYNFPKVSVIVCSRNEAGNLEKNLPFLLKQVYSNEYEVILVDDSSTDKTAEVVTNLQTHYPQLRYVLNEKSSPGKKQALQKGISEARFKHLLFTDADCYPASNQWMQKMMQKYSDSDVQIVLGYGAYTFVKETFLSLIIGYETVMTAAQYMSFALNGNAYMGVGRNLSYKKEVYDEKHFQSHNNMASGDDDLFIHQAAKEDNVAIALEGRSFTLSEAPTTWKGWFNQKVRHYTTGFVYKPKIKLMLGLFLFSKLLFYLLVIPLLLSPKYLAVAVVTFFLMIWIQKRSIHPLYIRLKASKVLINISAFIDFFWIISVFAMSLVSFFRDKKRWV